MQEKLFSIKELAEIFGVSQRTITRCVSKNTINAIRHNMYTIAQFVSYGFTITTHSVQQNEDNTTQSVSNDTTNVTRHEEGNKAHDVQYDTQKFVPYSDSFLSEIKKHTAELAEDFLQHSTDGNFICPFCGNGSGENGTGIKFNEEVAHCFVCGESFNIFQAIQKSFNCDFAVVVKTCAEALGLKLEYNNAAPSTTYAVTNKPVPIKKVEKIEKPQQDLTEYYNKCHANINDPKVQAYLKERGLDNSELIERFNLGYDPDCKCLVIPHNQYFCTRRYLKTWTDDKGREHRYKYLTGSKIALFNADCLSSEIFFVTEGAINALSIIAAGGEAIAIGGAGNGKILIEALQKRDNNPAVILLLDEDNPGQNKADDLLKKLYDLKYLVIKAHLPIYPSDNQDVNDLLRVDEEALKKFVANTIEESKTLKEKFNGWVPEPTKPAHIDIYVDSEDRIISLPVLSLELALPENYSMSEEGVLEHVLNKKTNQYDVYRVSYSPIVISKIIDNVDDNIAKCELACYDRFKKRWRKITDDNSVVFNSRTIISLAKRHLDVNSGTATRLVSYLAKFKANNIDKIPISETINNIGWRNNEFLPISKNSKYELDVSIKAKCESKFQSKGTKEAIMPLIKKLKTEYSIANMIIGATLAAPMRRKVFDHNIAVHFAGMTGCGKTAISTLAYSLFYNTNVEMPRFNGTRNGFERIFAGLRDLPVFIDDANNLSDKERSLAEKLIYDYVNGIPRVRTNKNLEEPILDPFYGTLLTTGEHFLTTNTSAGGAKTREIELNGGRKYLSDDLSRMIYRVTKENYGLFLRDWIEIIKNNQENMKATYNKFIYDILPSCITGKIPRHINNIAAIATANMFFDMNFLEMTEKEAENQATSHSIDILRDLPDYAQIADYERAKPIIRDMVITNLKRFVRFDKYHKGSEEFELTPEGSDTYGIIKKDSAGIVRHVLDEWLFKNGFNELTKIQLADDGFIIRNGRNIDSPFYNYPKKGMFARMYKIPIQYIFEEMSENYNE